MGYNIAVKKLLHQDCSISHELVNQGKKIWSKEFFHSDSNTLNDAKPSKQGTRSIYDRRTDVRKVEKTTIMV